MAASVDVLFTQRFLSSGGFNPGKLDGEWGPKTSNAQEEFDAVYAKTATELGKFDPSSEAKIHSLVPKAQSAARRLMTVAKKLPLLTVKIGSGTRSCAEQNHLYEQGRTAPGRIVTNARCGESLHNFGIAWDVNIFKNGIYYTGATAEQEKAYDDLAALALKEILGIDWGGHWKFVDKPHYQIATGGKSVTQLRELFEDGKPLVT